MDAIARAPHDWRHDAGQENKSWPSDHDDDDDDDDDHDHDHDDQARVSSGDLARFKLVAPRAEPNQTSAVRSGLRKCRNENAERRSRAAATRVPPNHLYV